MPSYDWISDPRLIIVKIWIWCITSLPNYFKNRFWLPTKCIFKNCPSSVVSKSLLFSKRVSISKENGFKSSLRNSLKTRPLFKKCYNFTFEKQKFCISTTNKMFSKKLKSLAQFCFKSFWFQPRSRILFKTNLVFKRVCNWFIKQDSCEKILFITFPKILAKPKLTFQI
jgi:hypothetical protein